MSDFAVPLPSTYWATIGSASPDAPSFHATFYPPPATGAASLPNLPTYKVSLVTMADLTSSISSSSADAAVEEEPLPSVVIFSSAPTPSVGLTALVLSSPSHSFYVPMSSVAMHALAAVDGGVGGPHDDADAPTAVPHIYAQMSDPEEDPDDGMMGGGMGCYGSADDDDDDNEGMDLPVAAGSTTSVDSKNVMPPLPPGLLVPESSSELYIWCPSSSSGSSSSYQDAVTSLRPLFDALSTSVEEESRHFALSGGGGGGGGGIDSLMSMMAMMAGANGFVQGGGDGDDDDEGLENDDDDDGDDDDGDDDAFYRGVDDGNDSGILPTEEERLNMMERLGGLIVEGHAMKLSKREEGQGGEDEDEEGQFDDA